MTDVLEYDRSETELTEAILETPAAEDRRRRVESRLDLQRGEDVLSIGCGPGLELAALADAVGSDGRAYGVDRSDAMLERATRRCADRPQAAVAKADAIDVPVADETFDAAVAVQVYEYVDDVPAALEELARVLRPGGRAVVCDADVDSLVWRSTNGDRMERVRKTFEDHCRHPRLGSELAPMLRDAGLTVERVEPHSICNTRLTEGTFVYHLMRARAKYVVDRNELSPAEARAWVDDLRDLEAAGGTFFSLTQYHYLVRRPE